MTAEDRRDGPVWFTSTPPDWRLLKFSWVVDIAEGQIDPEDATHSDRTLIAPNHIESGTGRLLARETASEQGAISGKYPCRRGDVLYSKIRPALRKATIAEEDCLCSADMYPLRPRELLASRYLLYLIVSKPFTEWAVLESDRVAMPKINRESLNDLRIPVPPVQVQERLVAFLDPRITILDELVAAKQRLLDLLAEKRKAIIATAVTRGLEPKVKLRDSGVPWLGEIPAHWAVVRLKHLLLGIEQGWSPECYGIPAGEDEWGVLRAGCCNGGRFNETDNKKLPPDLTPRTELEVRAGDVLMSRASGSSELIGSVALVPTNVRAKLMLSDKTYRLLVNRERVDCEFIVASLNSGTARVQIESIISGASGLAKNIGQSDVGELVFGVPPLDEQRAIVEHIARETAKLDAVRAATERTIALLKERRSALIAAAVTGQLDLTTGEAAA